MVATLHDVQQLETQLQGGGITTHPSSLTKLLTTLSASTSWPVILACLHALRRVFTSLHHRGALAPGVSGASSEWLRAQFSTFLSLLLRFLDGGAGGGGGALDARVLALGVAAHFFAHAAPLRVAAGAAHPPLNAGVLLWLVRHLLTAGGAGSAALYAGGAAAAPPGELLPLLTCDLGAAARAFRAEFIDEYDDVRLATLRAVRQVCEEKAGGGGGGGEAGCGGGGGGARKRSREGEGGVPAQWDCGASTASGATAGTFFGAAAAAAAESAEVAGGALSRSLVAAAAPQVVARNAAELLLALSLPATQAEWDAIPRTSWADEQLAEPLAAFRAGAGGGGGGGAPRAPPPPSAPAARVKFLAPDSDDDGVGGGDEDAALAALKGGGGAARPAVPRHWALSTHASALGEAWVSLLRLPLPPDAHRRVLLALPRRVLPLLPRRAALRTVDFLSDASAGGGAAALLALESFFVLMQTHGLEHPRFYPRLYALLGAPETPYAKYRARFFGALDLFMSSSALPSYLVAAFAKRAARVALAAPVGVALWALPFIYNLMKRHPGLQPVLLGRAGSAAAAAASSGGSGGAPWPAPCDPFDAATDDPSGARALESSLWEVVLLMQHTYAPVAHAARLLAGPLTKEEFDLSEGAPAAGGGPRATAYGDLAAAELEKKGASGAAAAVPFAFLPAGGAPPPPSPLSGGLIAWT
jgi:hypothetical protein